MWPSCYSLSKHARPDIQTAVVFLCTRVRGPYNDDYKNLGLVGKYLRGTKNMPLILEGDNACIIKWWVDASFAVHPDMKSHTGGAMSLSKGVVYGTSTRQKLNTKSSTEAELVGVNDVMPQILWTRYFLEAQGYGVKDSIINQDNQSSAFLLEKNGRASSGKKRAHHINIRYFFVADRIASSEGSVQYCPTGEMIADFFTKPLPGILFGKFRDFIMNIDPTTNSLSDQRSVLRNETNTMTKHGLHSREPQNIGKSRSTRKVEKAHYNSKIWFTDDETTLVRQWTIHCCFNSAEGRTANL
jgi:hypothetical protein